MEAKEIILEAARKHGDIAPFNTALQWMVKLAGATNMGEAQSALVKMAQDELETSLNVKRSRQSSGIIINSRDDLAEVVTLFVFYGLKAVVERDAA